MQPTIVRRVDRGHILLSNGWVARARCSRVTHPTPVWPPRRRLSDNRLNDQAKQAVKDAVGSRLRRSLSPDFVLSKNYCSQRQGKAERLLLGSGVKITF